MVLYLDIYLLENFIVNFFLLYITIQSVRINKRSKYILIASLIGSIYAGLILIYPINLFNNLFFKLFLASIMVFISIGKSDVLIQFRALVIFILYSMLLAGFCIFIQFNFSNSQCTDGVIINFSYKKLMLSLMIAYISIHRIIIFIKDRKEVINYIYDVDIKLKNETKTVQAFLDTGCELREPATNLPVMIIEDGIISLENIKDYEKFYISYKVINGFSGQLQGFKPEYITVDMGGKKENREVIIAFCNSNLDNYNNFQALLSRGII